MKRQIVFAVALLTCLVSLSCGPHHAVGVNTNPATPGQPSAPAAPTQQPSTPSPAQPDSTLNYLAPNAIAFGKVLPAPAADGSADDQAELASMLAIQNSRSVDDCARAQVEAKVSLDHFYGPEIGPIAGPLTAAEVQKLDGFFKKIATDTSFLVGKEKAVWNRSRPYNDSAEIHPCVPLESSSSYPSGHAAASRVFAQVLSLIAPERKTAFMARADQLAQDRVVGGVHRPSDVAARQKYGDLIFNALM